AEAYGQNGEVFVLNLTDLESKLGTQLKNLDELLEKTLETMRANLGV
ncbi:type I-E CRISPR-associated protein Cas7/Cse4/CasC, partial [Acinetobacter baumannii]|nr:type I-E CRISPR-associated protein Cas7/Cse4/CasC [Acinetobacter baumannii]